MRLLGASFFVEPWPLSSENSVGSYYLVLSARCDVLGQTGTQREGTCWAGQASPFSSVFPAELDQASRLKWGENSEKLRVALEWTAVKGGEVLFCFVVPEACIMAGNPHHEEHSWTEQEGCLMCVIVCCSAWLKPSSFYRTYLIIPFIIFHKIYISLYHIYI